MVLVVQFGMDAGRDGLGRHRDSTAAAVVW